MLDFLQTHENMQSTSSAVRIKIHMRLRIVWDSLGTTSRFAWLFFAAATAAATAYPRFVQICAFFVSFKNGE